MVCNDTIESIIAEMREFADTDSQTIGRDVLRRAIQHFADRIEAAMKRETVTDCNGLNTNSVKIVNSEKVIYNGAKIREALERVEKLAREFAAGNYYVGEFPKMLLDAIQPALAEPPRNCDRFADEEATQIVFLNEVWLIDVTTRYDYPFYCWTNLMKCRFIEWLFAKAKGGAE